MLTFFDTKIVIPFLSLSALALVVGLGLSDAIDVNAINFDSFDKNFDTIDIDSTELEKLLLKLTEVNEAECGQVNTVKTKTNEAIAQINKAESAFATSDIVIKIKSEGKKLIQVLKDAMVTFITVTNCYFVKGKTKCMPTLNFNF